MAASEIDRGKEFYQAKRYKSALESFTKAANLCDCNRGGRRRQKCKCRDYALAAAGGGRASIFAEAMHGCRCEVGRTFSPCADRNHVAALDYRAATFEAIGELDRARSDAEFLLELAPRRLEGYLRFGKILRLQKNDELAWKVYTAGIDVGRSEGLAGDRKFQLLVKVRDALHRRYYKRDPMELPHELIGQVFSEFDIFELSRMLRVSKRWNQVLSTTPGLWRDLHFKHGFQKPPRREALQRLARRAGDSCRTIRIADVGRFSLDVRRFNALLQASRNVKHLQLGELESQPARKAERDLDARHPYNLVLPDAAPWALSSLTSLVLVGPLNESFLVSILERTQETLQSLAVQRQPLLRDETWPVLPRLKDLRLAFGDLRGRLKMFPLASRTPNLEQLWLEGCSILPMEVPESDEEFMAAWPKLQALHYGPDTQKVLTMGEPMAQALMRTFPLLRPDQMRVLDIYTETATVGLLGSYRVAQGPPSPHSHPPQSFHNLEFYRNESQYLQPDMVQRIIGGSLESGRLTELAIQLWPAKSHWGMDPPTIREGWGWLEGAASIRRLGMYGFRPKNRVTEVAQFVESFPNLEVLELCENMLDDREFALLVEMILRSEIRGPLRELWQDVISGVALDNITALARKRGVTLRSLKTIRSQWPFPV